jgi:hypothetical protein
LAAIAHRTIVASGSSAMSIAVTGFCSAAPPWANPNADASPTPLVEKSGAPKWYGAKTTGTLARNSVFIALLPKCLEIFGQVT